MTGASVRVNSFDIEIYEFESGPHDERPIIRHVGQVCIWQAEPVLRRNDVVHGWRKPFRKIPFSC